MGTACSTYLCTVVESDESECENGDVASEGSDEVDDLNELSVMLESRWMEEAGSQVCNRTAFRSTMHYSFWSYFG